LSQNDTFQKAIKEIIHRKNEKIELQCKSKLIIKKAKKETKQEKSDLKKNKLKWEYNENESKINQNFFVS